MLEAGSLSFRAAVLLLAASCSAGPNAVREMYTVLQVAFTRAPSCRNSTPGADCCADCLGAGDAHYNLMFALSFGVGTAALPLAGWLLDKVGNSVVCGAALMSLLGACLVAAAASLRRLQLLPAPPELLPLPLLLLLLLGGAIGGLGFFPSVVARDRILASWFSEGSISFAMGLSGSINRLPTPFIFCFTELLREATSLQAALWLAAAAAACSFCAAVAASLLDASGCRQLQLTEELSRTRKSLRLGDLRQLSCVYWLLLGFNALAMAALLTLESNLAELIHEQHGYSKVAAGIMAGALRCSPILTAPLVGLVSDRFGCQAATMPAVALLLPPLAAGMTVTRLHPLVCVIGLGVLTNFVYITATGCVALVTPRATLGTALALNYSSIALLCGVLHSCVAAVLGHEQRLPLHTKLQRWRRAVLVVSGCYFLAFCAGAAASVAAYCTGSAIASRPAKAEDPDAAETTILLQQQERSGNTDE